MSLPELAVRRPIGVVMATLTVAIFGLLASQRLDVELLPDLAYPLLTVQTLYEDAAPLSVEQLITRPVEEAVGVVAGVREIRSVSRAGLSEVTLEFEWGQDMDLAALEVREKLGLANLPRQIDPPRVLRFDPSLDPVVRLALHGRRSLEELRWAADHWLKDRFEAVPGVAAARVRGGLVPEISVAADVHRLATMDLTLGDLSRALQTDNVDQPGGVLKDFNRVYLVRARHEFTELGQIRRTIVNDDRDSKVRVEDVATVTRGHRDQTEVSRLAGREVVEIALHREGAANVLSVAAAVHRELEELSADMSPDLNLTVLSDRSRYIRAAVDEVEGAAWLGAILAVVVLYFFLRDLSSTVIIALSIPISVIATFLLMRGFGVSLNVMSLGGLALGVGMMVDSSIVVLEAIDRRRSLGDGRRQAAGRGSAEVAAAVTASALTTVSVFLPVVFVVGVAGLLFRDLALTVCASLLSSLLVSLTLVPVLAAVDPGSLHRPVFATLFPWDEPTTAEAPGTWRIGPWVLEPVGDGRHRFSRFLTMALTPLRLALAVVFLGVATVGRAARGIFVLVSRPLWNLFTALEQHYPTLVRRAVRRRRAVLAVAFAALVLMLPLVPTLGTDLIPDLAQGEFGFHLRLPEGTAIASTVEAVAAIEAPWLADSRVFRVFSSVGSLPADVAGGRTVGENLARVDFTLRPGIGGAAERRVVGALRRQLSHYPRIDAELVRPAVLNLEPVLAVHIFSPDLGALAGASATVKSLLAALPTVEDVGTSLEPGSPEIRITLDREKASSLGVNPEGVARTLQRQVRGELVGEFREREERFDIRVRAAQPFRDRLSEIERLPIQLADGSMVPVSSLARVEQALGPGAIHRSGGARVAIVTAGITFTDLGAALRQVAHRLEAIALPPDTRIELAGRSEELETSLDSLGLAAALALFLVYVVMATQFESLIHPFIILTVVPLGAIGVVLALWLTGQPVSVLVLIGSIMFIGVVVNNAIVLIDAVNRRRRQGQVVADAVAEGAAERLRPILITTLTTVLALSPMALGLGEGAELRRPLAIAVIGGLLIGAVLTLVVTPCFYRALTPGSGSDSSSGADREVE